MRAKSIKNKAKVNADLSPAELKALLKKVKTETITFKNYIAALEGEVSSWRSGIVVPEEKWVTMEKVSRGEMVPSPPLLSGFKSPLLPDERPTTPAIVLEKDERDEFLRRENELMDQIAEKETELMNREKILDTIKEEMAYYKEQEQSVTQENQMMTSELSQLRLQLQKISYESKENAITVDSLKEANQELMAELDELKKNLEEIKVAQKKTVLSDKEKKKAEKMAEIMSQFDAAPLEVSDKERVIREGLLKLNNNTATHALSLEDLVDIKRDLADSRMLVEQHTETIRALTEEKTDMEERKKALEASYTTLEQEYEALLQKTMTKEEEKTVHMKLKLEDQQKDMEELKVGLEKKATEIAKLHSAINNLKAANDQLQVECFINRCSRGN